MRITVPGAERTGSPFQMTFEGRPVDAWPGESIGAALLSAGELGLRVAGNAEPRGIWCGMGVCGECRVDVDGLVRQACMTPARAGQRICRAPARVEATPAHRAVTSREASPDVLIVGAGPAGLSAARIAAARGLDVLVVDERAQAGGQYFKQPANGFAIDPTSVDRQTGEGMALINEAVAAGVRFASGMTMWAATHDDDGAICVHLSGADGPMLVRPRCLVLAMGAYERPWPVKGWVLPGVMSVGATQTLLRAYSTAPGKRVLVAGNGPLNAQVACELVRAGCEVVALAEAAARPGLAKAHHAAAMAAAAPRLVADGLAMMATLKRARVPMFYGHVVTGIDGDDRAREVSVARLDRLGVPIARSERRFAVDAVCMGYGFLPQAEAARALGCAIETGPDGTERVVRDDTGATSVHSVYLIGDGGGLGGARIAIAQGVLAGHAVADALKFPTGDRREAPRARRQLIRHRIFQSALWKIYEPVAQPVVQPEAVLCRCENITAGTIDTLIAGGATDVAAVKRGSRAGMGSCGGRYCAALIAQRIAQAGGAPADLSTLPGFAPRAPFKPVTIEAIAGMAKHNGRVTDKSSSEEH